MAIPRYATLCVVKTKKIENNQIKTTSDRLPESQMAISAGRPLMALHSTNVPQYYQMKST